MTKSSKGQVKLTLKNRKKCCTATIVIAYHYYNIKIVFETKKHFPQPIVSADQPDVTKSMFVKVDVSLYLAIYSPPKLSSEG